MRHTVGRVEDIPPGDSRLVSYAVDLTVEGERQQPKDVVTETGMSLKRGVLTTTRSASTPRTWATGSLIGPVISVCAVGRSRGPPTANAGSCFGTPKTVPRLTGFWRKQSRLSILEGGRITLDRRR